jgi:hypothetical protein
MPPIPVLALLALLGLTVYACIGGVVGVIGISILNGRSGDTLKVIAGAKKPFGNSWRWTPVMWGALIWPLVIACGAVVGMVCLVGIAPFWATRKVSAYAADAIRDTSEVPDAA